MGSASPSNLKETALASAEVSPSHHMDEMGRCWQKAVALFAAPLAVLVIALATNCNSLSCNLLPDDVQLISSLYALLQEHPAKLLFGGFLATSRVAGNIVSYTPLPQLTLAIDFAVWRTNPIGYHLSNLFFHLLASLALYMVALQIFSRASSSQKAVVPAFLASALFAASPAHADALARIGARADVMCAGFSFLSFAFFMKALHRGRSELWMGLSLGAAAGAFLCQGMALGLPAALSAYGVLVSRAGRLTDRLLEGVKQATPFWLCAFAYLLIRFLFTGTLIDGFAGATGGMFDHTLPARTESLLRILYPINGAFWWQDGSIHSLLSSLYFIVCLVTVLRAVWRGWNGTELNLVLFALAWFVLTQWPAARVWFVDHNLDGSRFLYCGTAPLCILLLSILFPVAEHSPPGNAFSKGKLHFLRVFAACAASGFVVWSGFVTVRQNTAWLSAGQQFQAVTTALEREVSKGSLEEHQKIVVLNLPRRWQGVCMVDQFQSLQDRLRAPFSLSDVSSRVAFVDPWYCYSENLVSVSRLRAMCNAGTYAFYMWDAREKRLARVDGLAPAGSGQTDRDIPCSMPLDEKLWTPILAGSRVNTADIDFVEIDVSSQLQSGTDWNGAEKKVELTWQDGSGQCFDLPRVLALPVATVGDTCTYRFPVSQYLSWTLARQTALAVRGSSGLSQEVRTVRLLSRAKLCPLLEPDLTTFNENSDGVLWQREGEPGGRFFYDATNVDGAVKAVAEISSNLSYGYAGTVIGRTTLSPHALKRMSLIEKRGHFSLPSGLNASKFEVRIACLSADNRVIGSVSDPITVKVCSVANAAKRGAVK